MSNATDIVKKGTVRRTDEFITLPLSAAAAERTFWPNAMLGLTTGGYVDKFDDTQSMIFIGLFRGREGKFVQPVSSAGDYEIDVHQPQRFEVALTSVAVTDAGKKAYASDDQTATLAGTTTYANLIGTVVAVVATNVALVEPRYDGVAAHPALGASRTMAATGNQTITRWDVGKAILVPNTGALTLTLPAAATVQAGARLTFVKTDATAAAVTLDGNSTETIDGGATVATMDAAHDTITIVSDGTNWRIVAQKIA